MKRLVSTIIMATLISAAALVPATALAADANGNHSTYIWFVGFHPPNTSMAPDGSTITMTGFGSMNAGPDKSVSGGGTYTTQNASGTTFGTWTATQMLGFVSYGPATPQQSAEFGGLPTGSTGGEAKFEISLSNGEAGVLTIHCLLGSPPAAKTMMEGITLILGTGVGGEYTDIVSGETIFIQVP
jgi:hypothetical protein